MRSLKILKRELAWDRKNCQKQFYWISIYLHVVYQIAICLWIDTSACSFADEC